MIDVTNRMILWCLFSLFACHDGIRVSTQGAEGNQPAMKIGRSEDMDKAYKIKDVNVHINVMYNKCE